VSFGVKDMNEKVSVIVVTYNRPKDVTETVESLLNQSVKPFEIIVVDDGSVPPAKIGFQKEKLKLIRFDQEVGLSNSRNYGVDIAQGEFIAFIDDDAIAESTWVEELQKGLEGADVIGGAIKPLYKASPPEWWSEKDFGGVAGVGNIWAEDMIWKVWGCNMGLRTGVFKTIGRFNPSLGRRKGKLFNYEEIDLLNRARAKGFRVNFVPEAVVFHKVPPKRMTISYILAFYYYSGKSKKIQEGFRPLKTLFDLISSMSLVAGSPMVISEKTSGLQKSVARTHAIKRIAWLAWHIGRIL
jgi:glucosyl-dolichyl phosphate glucuronosyltransferase